jgi:NADH-ubiquinone oxidoreductase chain 2
MLNIKNIGTGISIYNGFVNISYYNQIIEMFIFFIGSLILISLLPNKIKLNDNERPENIGSLVIQAGWLFNYPLIILFNLLGASCLITSSDLLFLYISIELQSFSLYILSSLNKNSIPATGAGLKYFLIGGLASCFILLGIGLIYSSTGLTQFESLTLLAFPKYNSFNLDLIFSQSNFNLWLESGLIFIVTGLLIKLGSAPFHQWAPDVYDKVPTKVTIWLVLIPKLSIFILLFELFNIFVISGRSFSDYYLPLQESLSTFEAYLFGSQHWLQEKSPTIIDSVNIFTSDSISITNDILKFTSSENFYLPQNLLILSSLISLIIGALLGLSQVKIKRLLAFSAISHIGFLLLSLSINTEISIESFFFYLIQYTLTNLNIFLILLSFGVILDPLSYLKDSITNNIKLDKNSSEGLAKDINFISELKGVFNVNPILSLSLAICLFSMAGVPPLLGFFAKQQVLYASISSEFIFLSFVAIIMSVISAYYYLKIIKVSHFDNVSDVKFKEALSFFINHTSIKNINNLELTKENTEYSLNIGSNLKTEILSNGITFLISLLTLIITLFIIKPNLLLNSTHILALNIFYT